MLQQAFKHFLLLPSILVVLTSGYALADEFRGKVLKVNGEVHIIDANGDRHTVEESKFLIRQMDTIVTAEGGQAIIRFNDGAMSVLDEKSSLQVQKTNWFSHLGGKIYFTFRKVFGEPRQVKTKFATLGIRGTTFIVYDDDNGQGVALQEGLLDIESPGPEFEIHRKKEMDEFETFKQQAREQQQTLRNEFDDYKQQMQREFIEYKKNFTLQANHVVRFDGTRVDESVMDENVKAEFDVFEAIGGDMLEEFREKARAHREQIEKNQYEEENN